MTDQTTSERPTKDQLLHFLEMFKTLDSFEAQQHMIRGYGAFDRLTATLPDPDVIVVISWLKELADDKW